MPIIKKDAPIQERNIIMVLYGVPSSGKTSVACTAENPVLIDTDRGFDRAVTRVDTLTASNWEDIQSSMNDLKGYKTIIVDTAKAMLDDYLWDYTQRMDGRLIRNQMKHFGAIGDGFKRFISEIRSFGADIIFICHDKQGGDDIVTHEPDCTGSSKNLLNRMADQEGYVFIDQTDNKRKIAFGIAGNIVTKDTAGLGTVEIPDAISDPEEFNTFMQVIIARTKAAIVGHSENNEAYFKAIDQLHAVDSLDAANSMLSLTKSLAKNFQVSFFTLAQAELKKKGYSFSKEKKAFVEDKPDAKADEKKPENGTKAEAEAPKKEADTKKAETEAPKSDEKKGKEDGDTGKAQAGQAAH